MNFFKVQLFELHCFLGAAFSNNPIFKRQKNKLYQMSTKKRSFKASVYKSALTAKVYHTWLQRNARFYNGHIKSEEGIILSIIWDVNARMGFCRKIKKTQLSKVLCANQGISQVDFRWISMVDLYFSFFYLYLVVLRDFLFLMLLYWCVCLQQLLQQCCHCVVELLYFSSVLNDYCLFI